MKQAIEKYVKEALAYFPFIPRDQLISMVILHFDIPDKEAREKVEEILDGQIDWLCWNCGAYNKAGWGSHCWKCHKPKQKPSFVRTIKSPPKPRPTSLKAIKEAVKKAPPKRVTAQSLRNKTYKG